MTKPQKKSPELRFKGFTEDWEQRKWLDTIDISTNMVDPKSGKYDDLPHIGPGNIESFTGQIYNNVNTVKEDNLISGKFYFNKGDIIYGKINPQLGKYFLATFEGLASADAYVLNTKNGLNQTFLFALLQTHRFFKYSVSVSMRSGMPKINRNELNEYKFNAPSELEQKRIGEFLLQFDNTITLHQRKYDALLKLKEAYLQNMFPATGESIPKIRFANFGVIWEQRKLGDFIEDYIEKTTIQNQYPVLTSSQQMGIVLQEEYYASRQVTTNENIGYFVLPKGYFTYRSRSDNGVFVFNRNDLIDKGIISYFYPVFRVTNVDSNFFLRRLNFGTERQVAIAAEGTGQHVLSLKKFKEITAMFPLVEEQIKIGQLFNQLDNLITLHQQKLEKLNQLKEAYLQKMFV